MTCLSCCHKMWKMKFPPFWKDNAFVGSGSESTHLPSWMCLPPDTIYYYLDKSSKRKSSLCDIQIMRDADVRKILKMSSTRWLSLGQCVNHLLQQWNNLTLFWEWDGGRSRLNLVLLISLKQHFSPPACLQCSPRSPPLSHQRCPHLNLVLQRSL